MLALIASGVVDSFSKINTFFENTLYWHQLLETNQTKLNDIVLGAKHAAEWLIEHGLVDQQDNVLLPTALGRVVSTTGLLPGTAISFLEILRSNIDGLEKSFDEYAGAIVHWVCNCDEYTSDTPSRFLPYPSEISPGSTSFVLGRKMIFHVDRANSQVNQCVHALILFAEGVDERKIGFMSKVQSGSVHRLATDVAWVIDGLRRISCTTEAGCSQQLTNKLGMLARTVRWGVLADALDMLRVAEQGNVPGFGRQRAMALLANGLNTFEGLLHAGRDKLVGILRDNGRVDALIGAISGVFSIDRDRLGGAHSKLAESLGIDEVVVRCERELGAEYERAISDLLCVEQSWSVQIIDDVKRQNVPDILLRIGDISVLIECKTCTKSPALIKKEEAFAVLQKAVDFDPAMKRVTLGKPKFDEHSKMKAQGSSLITLIEHDVFVEGLLRVHAGAVSPQEFVSWLSKPGVTEIERLGGDATYRLINK